LICTATKIHQVDQNNEDDVYGVLDCVGGEEKYIQDFDRLIERKETTWKT